MGLRDKRGVLQVVLTTVLLTALIVFAALISAPPSPPPSLFDPIQNKDVAAVRAALARHADVNQADLYGFHPLELAIGQNSPQIVELLVNAGADMGRLDRNGFDALGEATLANKPEILRLLIAHGAPLENPRRRRSLLNTAAVMSPSLVRVLLAAGADPNARFPGEQSPLQCAIDAESPEAIQALLAAGAVRAKSSIPPLASHPQRHA